MVLESLPGRDVRRRVLHLHADARRDGLRPEAAVRVRRRDPAATSTGHRRAVRPRRRRAVPHRRDARGVGRRPRRAGASRPTAATTFTARYYVVGRRHPQPHEAAGDRGHGGLRRPLVPHGALGLRLHRRRPDRAARRTCATRSSGSSGPARPASRRCRRWPKRRSTSTCSSAPRRPSASAATAPTEPDFVDTCTPGWQRERMDNFQAIMLGRPVDADLTDDGWTHHYAKVQNAPRWKGMTFEEYMLNAEDDRLRRSWRSTASASTQIGARSRRRPTILKPYYRYLCKRPCFHDEYLDAYNNDNVTLVDCPTGFDGVTAKGPVVERPAVRGRLPHLRHRVRSRTDAAAASHRARIVGRDGVTLAEKCAEGAVDAVRHDEPRLPEHVHHADAGAAVGRHRQLHAARDGRCGVRRRRGRACSTSAA